GWGQGGRAQARVAQEPAVKNSGAQRHEEFFERASATVTSASGPKRTFLVAPHMSAHSCGTQAEAQQAISVARAPDRAGSGKADRGSQGQPMGHRGSTMVLLAFRHGLRVSELVDLRWDQVDLENGILHVRRVKQGTPATHPLTGRELRALRRLQPEAGRLAFCVYKRARHTVHQPWLPGDGGASW